MSLIDVPLARNFLSYLISSDQMEQPISAKNSENGRPPRSWRPKNFLRGLFETDMPLRPSNKPFSSFPFFLMSSLDEIK